MIIWFSGFSGDGFNAGGKQSNAIYHDFFVRIIYDSHQNFQFHAIYNGTNILHHLNYCNNISIQNFLNAERLRE